jgi:hypothetical protein
MVGRFKLERAMTSAPFERNIPVVAVACLAAERMVTAVLRDMSFMTQRRMFRRTWP